MTPTETIAACRLHWKQLPPHARTLTAICLLEAIEVAEHLLAQINSKPEAEGTTYGPAIERNVRREME